MEETMAAGMLPRSIDYPTGIQYHSPWLNFCKDIKDMQDNM
jgi:hypothetical protein